MRLAGVRPSRSRYLGMALILVVGILHLIRVPTYYDQAAYLGALLVGNFLACLVAGAGILRGMRGPGWTLGALIATASLAAYVYSRTAGLPDAGRAVGEWGVLGVISIVVEALFLILFLAVIGKRETAAPS